MRLAVPALRVLVAAVSACVVVVSASPPVGAGRVGKITEFPIPTPNSEPEAMVVGPDGNLWFTEYRGNKIGRIRRDATITEYRIPTRNSLPRDMVVGPDGNPWFTEYSRKIGRIRPDGKITEFPLPTPNSCPRFIVGDTDGNLWFTEYCSAGHIGSDDEHHRNKIGRIGTGAAR